MKHTYYTCPDPCRNPGHCDFCDGGLAMCTTCNGAEGTLPTDCPGVKMTSEQQDAVYAGRLDFRGGAWHTTLPKRSS